MPDDDAMLGQNLVDVRNEERVFACRNPEADWINDARADARADLEDELYELWERYFHLCAAEAVNSDAEARKQESKNRVVREIHRLTKGLTG